MIMSQSMESFSAESDSFHCEELSAALHNFGGIEIIKFWSYSGAVEFEAHDLTLSIPSHTLLLMTDWTHDIDRVRHRTGE